jgi:acetylornithine deacetylase/succinyl-diaminopimelate desuccinylase-like protein
MLAGGVLYNVIPAEAEAALNVRTLPGESLEDVLERLRRTVGDERVRFEVLSHAEFDPPAMAFDTPMFAAIRDAVHALDPGIVVVPYLSTGATDSAPLRAAGIQAYGLLPFPLDAGDEARMHGHDERVPVASLHFGTRLVYEALVRVAG